MSLLLLLQVDRESAKQLAFSFAFSYVFPTGLHDGGLPKERQTDAGGTE